MDPRHMHSSRGGGGSGGMPGMQGMGMPPGGPGNGPPHHHLSHQPPHHHGPPPASGPHYDERDRMSGPVGRIHRPSPPSSDPYYGHHHQQQQPHHSHQQHHQQQLQHHQQHPQPPHHAQHSHQPPLHHAPHPAHGIQQPTRQYKEHSRSPESERMPSSYRAPPQQRNDSLTPLSITSRPPVGPPPSMYSMPRSSTPDQQHTPSRAPSLTGSPAVYRGPHHPPPPPPPPPPSHTPHHPHPPHHQMGPESMMNPPPPHHRGMPPPSSPHHTSTQIQQQPPLPQHQSQQQHPQQGRQPPPPPSHPSQSAPYPGGRDLPSLNNAPSQPQPPPPPPPPPRQNSGMSISAMLDGPAHPTQTAPPKPPPSQPTSDYNSSKRSYTPDYPHQNVDRSRNASIASSPGIMNNQHQGYGPPGGKGRATPDHGYRPHMPHGPPGIIANHPHGVPPRPVSQPLAPTTPHSLSSVLHQHQDEGPHRGHARSASYHDRETNRERERERDREREREMVQRERYEHEMREREIRELREREHRERELRERDRNMQREREMREREQREREMREEEQVRMQEVREREIQERERREREMRERDMQERERRERERREREMREREMREREMLERERREREMRERERQEIEREREAGARRERERERIANNHMDPSSPHAGHHPHQLGPPVYHSHPLTSTSNHPSVASATPPAPHGPPHTPMATLPPQQSLNPNNHGPPNPPPQTSSSYQSFGYTTAMPPSPFALPPPPPGEGHDRRRQGYADNQHGRAEELLLSKQMNERKSAAQIVAQAQIDRKNPLLTMSGYEISRMEEAMSGQPVSKRGMMEKEEKEESIVGGRGRTKEKIEKEREAEEEGPLSTVGMNTGKKRRHHHVHHHHPHHHHVHHHMHDNDERFYLDGGPLHSQAQSIAQTGNKRAMTPVPHHHHPPRHHSPAPQPPTKRPKLIINSTPVVASVANLPRCHLGSMVYNPSSNSIASNKGYSTTHSMLPRFEGRENCIFQVRIPRRYLYERERAEVCKRRCLWGSDVYTDDSDVLAVLVHLGKIPPVLPDGIEPELVLTAQPGVMEDKDREIGRKGNRAAGKGKGVVNGSSIAIPATTSTDRINGALPVGTKSTPSGYLNINKDIIVDILILPPLEKYSSTVRNAIKSRSWTKQHDGMSYMVHEVKTAEPGEAEGRGKSMRKQRLNEREHIRKWGTLPGREGEGGLRTLVGREAKVGA